MSIYTPASDCSGDAVIDYTCNPCPTYEYSRVRSIAFVKTSYRATLQANPTNATLWSTGMDDQNIIMIYKTQGSYDGGSTTELTGFGDDVTFNGNTTHTITYKDPNYSTNNTTVYNALKGSSEYEVVYRTSSKIHFTEAPVTITPKAPVADDISAVQTYEIQLKWTNPDMPTPVAAPAGIFDTCYVNG